MTRVALIATGGTITSVGRDRLDPFYGETGEAIGAAQLLARVPEIGAIATAVPVAFPAARSSHEMTVGDWLALRRTIASELDAGRADAAVVAHGTNTLEETAYFLALTLAAERPVVVTGSMRPSTGLSSDADLNLLNAIRVAAAVGARGRGVLVALDGTIHRPREVTKLSTHRLDAFGSPDTGPLGRILGTGEVVYHRGVAAAPPPFEVAALSDLPRVDIVVSYLGSDGRLLELAADAGAAGIVHAGTGGGRVTPAESEAIARVAARGVIVCRASRVAAGAVARDPEIAAGGMVSAGELTPWKARVLLALALTRSRDAAAIQRTFEAY